MATRSYLIPQDTLDKQAEASDPANSVWVSAHAGSGKTHVLSQRVVRLLLDGTDPSRILCLTYTRAAAANMSNRIFRDLGRWAMLDDARLSEEISRIEGRAVDDATCRNARRLFARALETPGGLKIQTIHAFCEALLHQFPLEANIAGHFELIEGQAAAALVSEARRALLVGTGAGNDLALEQAFATVLQRGGEHGLDKLLDEIVTRRGDLTEALVDLDPAELLAEHGFTPSDTSETIRAGLWPDAFFSEAFANDIIACAAGKVRATEFGEALRAAAKADESHRFERLRAAFLNDNGEARGTKQIAVKEVQARWPDFVAEFERFSAAIVACRDRLALLDMVQATQSALVIADRLIANYARLKHAGGFLDFDDLIRRTIALLGRADAGPWIRYRLDQGIDHILVDEAQDTSPDQWEVIRQLSDEFFVEGARADARRTVFAVGDEKQSIYSFQGAEPEAFDLNRRGFEGRVISAGHRFRAVRLDRSFRSTEDVLSAVDLVFASEQSRQGLTQDPDPFEHKAIRRSEPGRVEAWPFIGVTQVEEPDDWTQAIDHASAPAVKLAEAIAERIQSWLRTGEMLEGKGRVITPGDVMILVRKRDRFVHAVSRALKNRHIAVAGADRLSLPGHIAVQDLIALGRVMLQPEDDLALAALLKSPIFGMSEEELFTLAHGRGLAVSLFSSLRRRASASPRFAEMLEKLDRWRSEAGFAPAFEFYANVLGRDGVRGRMIARLGHEAGEILDEFLNFTLNAEQASPPDLESVLALLDAAGPDIKREMDQSRDEVRIMTVHAAKGLEAPVVFLVDSGGEPFTHGHLPRLLAYETAGPRPRKRFLWRASGEMKNSVAKAMEDRLKEKAGDEYRRLLYVGMTRAEDRLVTCGYRGVRGAQSPTWLSMIRAGLRADPATVEEAGGEGDEPVLVYRVTPPGAVEAQPGPADAVPTDDPPDFLYGEAPPAPKLPRPLAPSRASALIEPAPVEAPDMTSPVLDPQREPSLAIARGTAIHRMLQLLPDMPVAARADAGQRYLEKVGADWPQVERQAALGSVLALIENPAWAGFFAPGSRAEVSVMGTLEIAGQPRAIAGTIDRLAIEPGRLMILDYKTNRMPPAGLDDIPPAYVMQLALYRALLQGLYPGRRIDAGLLFTEAPSLMLLPESVMEAALAGLTGQ